MSKVSMELLKQHASSVQSCIEDAEPYLINEYGEPLEIADELRTAYMDLPSNEDVRKKMNENWKVYDFMQTAQVPSEELLSQFWIHSSDNAKELPLEK